jgi:hypothetical protein
MKVPIQFPRELAEMPEATGLPSKVIVMPVSLAAKPEPITVTTVPGGPFAGLIERLGFSNVKVTLGTTPEGVIEPKALTVWVPNTAVETVKVPLQFPRESAVIAEVIGLLSKVILTPVSLALKPEPVTVTTVPGSPLIGLMVMTGVAA